MKLTRRLFSLAIALCLLLSMIPVASAATTAPVTITAVDEIPADAVLLTTDMALTPAQEMAIANHGRSPKASITAPSAPANATRAVTPVNRVVLDHVVSYPLFVDTDGSLYYSTALYVTTYGNGLAHQGVQRNTGLYATAQFLDKITIAAYGVAGTINYNSYGTMFYYAFFLSGYASGSVAYYEFEGAGTEYTFEWNYPVASIQAYDNVFLH